MKESEFQGWVIDVARRCGWRVWHVPMPVRPTGGGKFVPDTRGAGLPDLILLHADPPRMILAELKSVDGKIKPEQAEFLRLARGVAGLIRDTMDGELAGAGKYTPVGVYSWRPGSEHLIEAILRGKVLVQ